MSHRGLVKSKWIWQNGQSFFLRSEAEFNAIFTYFLLTSNCAPLFFSQILNKYGLFVTRVICASFTSAGLMLLCFYESSPYFIWASWQLLGVACVTPIMTSIRELCPLFPNKATLTIGLVNGFLDASGGIFLLFKLIYDSHLSITTPTMLLIYAACSSIIWIKTFFLCPRYFVKEDNNQSVFRESFIGSLCRNTVAVKKVEPEKVTEKLTFADYKKSLLSPVFLTMLMSSTVLTLRLNSFPTWCLPWLRWTFREFPDDEADELVSQNMDIYGLLFFASIILCPIPGNVKSAICKKQG